MNDRYTPALPGTGTCPHCSIFVDAGPRSPRAVRTAFLHLECRNGHVWYEVRTAGEVSRHWTPLPLPVESA